MSAGLGTPLIRFVPWPFTYLYTLESAQLETQIAPWTISTPSNWPGPVAMTVGAASPGFHANRDGPPKGTTMNRPLAASQVMPLGRLNASPFAATLTLRSGAIRKIWSAPGCSTPDGPNLTAVSVTYSEPSGAAVMSFRKI